jgi:hypothetical protein
MLILAALADAVASLATVFLGLWRSRLASKTHRYRQN